MSFDMLKSETNLEKRSLPSGSSQATIQSIRNTCFHLSLHEAESEMGRSPKNSNRNRGRFQVRGMRTHELAAASHSWSKSNNKHNLKLTNRASNKTATKKGFSEWGGELSKGTYFRPHWGTGKASGRHGLLSPSEVNMEVYMLIRVGRVWMILYLNPACVHGSPPPLTSSITHVSLEPYAHYGMRTLQKKILVQNSLLNFAPNIPFGVAFLLLLPLLFKVTLAEAIFN